MAQKKLLFSLILFFVFTTNVSAADRFEFKKKDIEFAKDLARKSRQLSMVAIKDKWLELKKIESASSLNLDKVEFNHLDSNLLEQTTLRVFVSSSMSNELLKQYVQKAKIYKAILVFNGLPNGSWHKLSDLIYEITGGAADGVSIQLDDNAFSQYQIVSVPSFVLSKEPSIFGVNSGDGSGDRSVEEFDKIVGNIGIKRALEEMVAKGDLMDGARKLLEDAGGKI